MKNYGKFKSSPETVYIDGPEVIDEEGNKTYPYRQSYNVVFLRDNAGNDMIDVVKADPCDWYLAVLDDGTIVSMQQDIEQSQIADTTIIGINDPCGYKGGQGCSVYGKIWNGTTIVDPPEPIPSEISKRQFFQQLAIMEIITFDEALSAIQVGSIPKALDDIINELPTEQERMAARMLIVGASSFRIDHELSNKVRIAMRWSKSKQEKFWVDASKL